MKAGAPQPASAASVAACVRMGPKWEAGEAPMWEVYNRRAPCARRQRGCDGGLVHADRHVAGAVGGDDAHLRGGRAAAGGAC